MSTRSMIALQNRDGSIVSVYSHWNGLPIWNGVTLVENYYNEKLVAELLAQGDISILREKVGKKHDFDDWIKVKPGKKSKSDRYGWTTFYSRDRGESCPSIAYASLDKFAESLVDTWCEYIYLFKVSTGKWYFTNAYNERTGKRRNFTPKCFKLLTNKYLKPEKKEKVAV